MDSEESVRKRQGKKADGLLSTPEISEDEDEGEVKVKLRLFCTKCIKYLVELTKYLVELITDLIKKLPRPNFNGNQLLWICYFFLSCSIIVAVIFALAPYLRSSLKTIGEPHPQIPINWNEKITRLLARIRNLSKMYKEQDVKTWSTILAGLERSANTSEIGVFLLLHQGGRTAYCIATELAKVSQELLETKNHIRLESSDIKHLNQPSDLNNYKERINDSKVMVVTELEKIPGEFARHFHTFCDLENPMVPGAVYLFLLEIDNFKKPTLMKEANAELEKLWSEMEDNLRLPLITRLSQHILGIKKDKTSC